MMANKLQAGRDSLISLVLRLQDLTAPSTKMTVLWDGAQCNGTARHKIPEDCHLLIGFPSTYIATGNAVPRGEATYAGPSVRFVRAPNKSKPVTFKFNVAGAKLCIH
jgi:hypothetical protein